MLGCIVGKHGVRADPEKVKAVKEWPVPRHVKDLRQFLGLANYLHNTARIMQSEPSLCLISLKSKQIGIGRRKK